jgi:hypothetical protein
MRSPLAEGAIPAWVVEERVLTVTWGRTYTRLIGQCFGFGPLQWRNTQWGLKR